MTPQPMLATPLHPASLSRRLFLRAAGVTLALPRELRAAALTASMSAVTLTA